MGRDGRIARSDGFVEEGFDYPVLHPAQHLLSLLSLPLPLLLQLQLAHTSGQCRQSLLPSRGQSSQRGGRSPTWGKQLQRRDRRGGGGGGRGRGVQRRRGKGGGRARALAGEPLIYPLIAGPRVVSSDCVVVCLTAQSRLLVLLPLTVKVRCPQFLHSPAGPLCCPLSASAGMTVVDVLGVVLLLFLAILFFIWREHRRRTRRSWPQSSPPLLRPRPTRGERRSTRRRLTEHLGSSLPHLRPHVLLLQAKALLQLTLRTEPLIVGNADERGNEAVGVIGLITAITQEEAILIHVRVTALTANVEDRRGRDVVLSVGHALETVRDGDNQRTGGRGGGRRGGGRGRGRGRERLRSGPSSRGGLCRRVL